MDTSKKRIIKRKKKVAKNKSSDNGSKNIPTMEEREKESVKFQDVSIPIYSELGNNFNRLNMIPDYTTKTKAGVLENTLGTMVSMQPEQFANITKDKNLTILERMCAQLIKKCVATKEEPDFSEETLKYVFNRVYGKPKDRVEHSGNVHQTFEAKTKQVPDIENFTVEELEKFKTSLKLNEGLPMKAVEITKDEE